MEPLIPEKPIWVLPRHPKSWLFGQTKNTHQNQMWSDQLQVLSIVVVLPFMGTEFAMARSVVSLLKMQNSISDIGKALLRDTARSNRIGFPVLDAGGSSVGLPFRMGLI